MTGVNRLDEDLRCENAKWRARHRLQLWIYGCLTSGCAASLLVSRFTHSYLLHPSHFAMLALSAVLGTEGIGLLSRPTVRHRRAMRRIAYTRDVSLVGTLLECLAPAHMAGAHIFYADPKLYYEVMYALTHLLPQVTDMEYRLLYRRHKKTLYLMLSSQFTEVALPAIKLVKRIGDEGAIPTLQKVAMKKVTADTALAVREAARDCLAELRHSLE